MVRVDDWVDAKIGSASDEESAWLTEAGLEGISIPLRSRENASFEVPKLEEGATVQGSWSS